MVQLWTPEELTNKPFVLDVIPPALGAERSPQRCSCSREGVSMSAAQRAAHERIHADWRVMRIAWCDANGYLLADLLRAERARDQRQFDYR